MPTSPISLPAIAVINPMSAIVIKIPIPKTSEIKNVFFKEISPCELINPMTNGILERWQGLKRTLTIPQPNDAKTAVYGLPVRAELRKLNIESIILLI